MTITINNNPFLFEGRTPAEYVEEYLIKYNVKYEKSGSLIVDFTLSESDVKMIFMLFASDATFLANKMDKKCLK